MKWDKGRGGWIAGKEKPPKKTFEEHLERWNSIMLDWEKKEPWRMFFPIHEVIKRFNRNRKSQGYARIYLVNGTPTLK